MSLKSRNAVVTGSTSGIGLSYARALAAQGANVMINGFGDAAAIEKERAAIESEFGVKAVYSAADMTRPDQIAAMIEQAHHHLRLGGHPDQQRRHPVRLAHRGLPAGEVGPDHRHQTCPRPSTPCARPSRS